MANQALKTTTSSPNLVAARNTGSGQKHAMRRRLLYDPQFRGLPRDLNDHLIEELWDRCWLEFTRAELCDALSCKPDSLRLAIRKIAGVTWEVENGTGHAPTRFTPIPQDPNAGPKPAAKPDREICVFPPQGAGETPPQGAEIPAPPLYGPSVTLQKTTPDHGDSPPRAPVVVDDIDSRVKEVHREWGGLGLDSPTLTPGLVAEIDRTLDREGEDVFRRAGAEISASPFLRGVDRNAGPIRLAWLLRPENLAKVLDGTYRPHGAPAGRSASAAPAEEPPPAIVRTVNSLKLLSHVCGASARGYSPPSDVDPDLQRAFQGPQNGWPERRTVTDAGPIAEVLISVIRAAPTHFLASLRASLRGAVNPARGWPGWTQAQIDQLRAAFDESGG